MVSYYSVKIESCEGVYAPAEDTFLLADAIQSKEGEKVLDMCTGTGLLGLIAAKKGGSVLAVDISDSAVECARGNAKFNDVEGFNVKKSNLFSNITGRFDLIIVNPPYLPVEEGERMNVGSLAWGGGVDGRAFIDRFLSEVRGYLVRGGRVLMLGSSLSDYKKTIRILEKIGFTVFVLQSKKIDFEELVVIEAVYDF